MKKRWIVVTLAVTLAMAMAVQAPPTRGEGSMTLAALRIVHQRECDARQQYDAFAARAEEEGYLGVRDLFTALKQGEEVHVRIHEVSLGRMEVTPVVAPSGFLVDSTARNLCVSFETELNERNAVYGRLMEHARAECQYDALAGLRYARDAEATHARALANAYFHLTGMRNPRPYFVCSSCGALQSEAPTTSCVCGAFASSSHAVGPGPAARPPKPEPRASEPVAVR